ncbi:MAG TPA: hypothetical protein VMT27_05815, partial [Actinomycetes bacterium]|nr:hypothetical protein [Actinomycetes bacterium]
MQTPLESHITAIWPKPTSDDETNGYRKETPHQGDTVSRRLGQTIATALITLVSLASVGMSTPAQAAIWDDDGGLAIRGVWSPDPLAPRSVWAAPTDRTITELGGGSWNEHGCMLDADGAAVCFGSNENGALGRPYSTQAPVAVDMDGALQGVRLVDIEDGDEHSCAVGDDGEVYCWGWNDDNQLGLRTFDQRVFEPTPVDHSEIPPGTEFTAVGAGLQSSCAVTTE